MTIDVAASADSYDQYDQDIVANFVNDPVASNANSVKSFFIRELFGVTWSRVFRKTVDFLCNANAIGFRYL